MKPLHRQQISPTGDPSKSRPDAALATGILMPCIVLLLFMHGDIAFNRAINWDEFYHHSLIYDLLSGELSQTFQTFMARIYSWVPDLTSDIKSQFLILRIGGLATLLIAAISIFLCTRAFASRSTSLVCSLSYLGAGYVLQHGASYRADTLAAGGLLLGASVLLRTDLRFAWLAIGATITALASMLTIKVVLFAPIFAGVALYRLSKSNGKIGTLKSLVLFVGLTVVIWMAGIYFHSLSIKEADPTGVVSLSLRVMFGFGDLPYYSVIPIAAILSLPLAIAILITPIVLLIKNKEMRHDKYAIWGFWLPVLSLAFYHNTAPYFYAYLLAPLAVACAPVFDWFCKRYSPAFLGVLILLNAGAVWSLEERQTLKNQMALLKGVQSIAPNRYSYFDANGMAGWLKKENHFTTLVGQDRYWHNEVPRYADVMAAKAVPLVLATDPAFQGALDHEAETTAFFAADRDAIRESYIPFWGPVHLAGKELEPGEQATWNVRVPGSYTVKGRMLVDGTNFETGDVIELRRGTVMLAETGDAPASLTWGDNIAKPSLAPPSRPYWTGF